MRAFIPRSLARRIAATHVNHRRVAAGAMTVAIFVALAKLLIAAKELAMAWRYGVSGEVDAYQLAFTVATWAPLILTAIGTSVLVPALVGLARRGDDTDCLVAELNGAAIAAACLVALIVLLAGPQLIGWMAERLAPATQQLAQTMVRQLAPLGLLTVLAGYLAVRLQARERFGYTLLEAAPSVGIIAFILAAPYAWGAAPLIWGTLAGAVVQAAWLAIMTRRSAGGMGGLAFSYHSPHWPALYRALAMMAAGQMILALGLPIDQVFAARLNDGSVAVLGYVNRLIALVTGLGTLALGRALLPVLAGVAADGDLALGRAQTLKWSWAMLLAGAAVAGIGWLLAPWGVALVFERGAFSEADSEAVAHVLRFGLVQVPFFFAGIVLVQWFAALRRYDVLLKCATFAIVVKVAANFLLAPAFGLAGLMLATGAMYAATFAFQAHYISRL